MKKLFSTHRNMLMLMLLFTHSLTMQASDWVRNESKYNASMQGDHLRLEVFLADLDKSNTYSQGGHVYATNGSKTIDLMYLKYINQGDDESQTAEVKAYICEDNAKAWFTNSQTGEQEIGTSERSFWLTKWGDDHHYMTAYIDYYFPAELAGQTWKIYYNFKHSNDDWYDMVLSYSITVDGTLGLSPINAGNYTCERTSPDNIRFTVPKLPDDIPSKVSSVRQRVCTYDVSYTFTSQSGTVVTKRETIDCDKNQSKQVNIAIPDEAGNPQQIDLRVTARQGVKDAGGNYFWQSSSSYSKNNVFPTVPVPGAITTEFRQFDKVTDLAWSSPTGGDYMECTPYIYRVETDNNGQTKSGTSWSKRGTIANATGRSLSFTDDNVQQGTFYKYRVVNIPKAWIDNGVSSSQLNNPTSDLLDKLGYAESSVMSTAPTMSIYSLTQDTTVTDRVRLTWQYSRVPTDATTVNFKVMRRVSADSEWSEYGTVNGDAQPSAGASLSFVDTSLPNNVTVRYQYKVRLSLLGDKYLFESDIATAGLLKGSSVKQFEATKGTHASTVRLTWNSKQVGSGNSTYVISRRYVNSGDDFMRINTTSGDTEQFTYEDNTVQPGYYYEYRIEAYSGNVLQNTLYDVGFCQARGVISGRITFGTGTSVEDVRMNLQPSNTGDDNSVRGYSQRVDGASAGIAWEADSVAIAKVFGPDKDYTVQMFVRPDYGLQEGAVIGEIPGVGRLLVGSQTSDGYKLLCRQAAGVKHNRVFTQINHFKGFYYSSRYYSTNGTWNGETVYGSKTADQLEEQIYNEGFQLAVRNTLIGKFDNNSNYIYLWLYHKLETLEAPIVCGYDMMASTGLYDLGITLPAGVYSLLTVENKEGRQTFSVGDVSSSSMTVIDVSEGEKIESGTVTPTCQVYNGQPVSFEGSYVNALSTMEDKWGPYVQTVATSTQVSGESVPLYSNTSTPLSIGGATGITAEQGFKGNFAEVRVWNHALTNAEKTSYADRILNGREQGLSLYWPMDEGLDRYVFDASYANDIPNGRHATVGNNITASNIIPTDNQLSRYAMTNANGEYIIRGIPFVGSGSTYTVLPTKGIHEFNPISRNGFIGNGSLTLNSYDFTDVSSFPVRGKVTYLNTNIPVDSVQFMIDGNLVQSKEGVRSDANGEYEISVPIGEHLIECYMNGHRFTSFPLDGTTYDFKKSEEVNFVDSTLVNVTGRVNGGFSDQAEPLGFNRSVNRIGQATIKLSLGKEGQCSFNYITDDHGISNFGTVSIPVASATDSIKSTAYRAALNSTKPNNTDTYYVYIKTDPKTGEFSAMLPPLKYKVESITFEGDKDGVYDDETFFTQNLPTIDASNAIKENMRCDSVSVEGVGKMKYEYSAKMIRQYRSDPLITVKQNNLREGAFGELGIEITNTDFTTDSVTVCSLTDDSYHYVFGHPIYQQDKAYSYSIDVSENYVNVDTKETFKEIPQDAVIHISNDASSTTTVFAEAGKVGNDDVEMGMPYETYDIDVTPDEKGHVEYNFVAGWPNFADGHLLNMSVAATIDGRTTLWRAPDSQTEALDLIVLGSIGSGTNFVTQGPDAVDMIIRRPPGSTSTATLTNKQIHSYAHTKISGSGHSENGGVYISETPTWEIESGTVMGIAVLAKSKFKIVSNQKFIYQDKFSDTDVAVNDTTYSVTESMTTPSSMVIDLQTMSYTPEGGDTYIGRSTNLLFSKGRILGIYKQDDGTYKIDDKTGVTVGQQFGTTFVFPQAYILNTLIPNWEAIIKSRLEEGHISGDHTISANTPKVPGKIIYYTKYNPDDAAFGKSNADTSFWTEEQIRQAGGCPSYKAVNGTDDPNAQDEVQNAINQIKLWRARIADNEEDKLNAFNGSGYLIDNFSIASGSKISQTTETTIKSSKSSKHDSTTGWYREMNFGTMVNDAGAYLTINMTDYDNYQTSNDTINTHSNSVAWTMSDGDVRTALTVDVYKSPKGWGPIFRTRGGQTANPYEAGSETKFYQPGTELNTATMKVENPQLKVIGSAEITDVPTGSQAEFKLQLSNQSETNDICNYVLQVKEKSNPNGAVLTVDGNILSNGKDGRLIKIKGGETVEKTLMVAQSDRSVTDYEDIVLYLKSEKDPSIESDPVKLRVHFVPASAHVDLSVDHAILNKADKDLYGGITATMQNLDRQDEGLQGIRLRYRRKGTDSWTVDKQWSDVAELRLQDYEPMPEGSTFKEKVVFPDDGTYELQAQTFGLYGNDEVTYESNIIEIVQDTHGPKILGMVSPVSGQLTYENRNEMHLRFNEVLNGNALSKSENFRIEGGMNNVVFGEGQYPDVAVQLNGERIETDALYELSHSNYAFDMWFYRQGDGTIIGLGTENNLLSLSTHDNGKLQARVGTEADVYDTGVRLPENKWVYMAMNYKCKSASDPQNRITMLYATADDKDPIYIGENMSTNDLNGHGKLSVGGDGMTGMVAELSIWNNEVTAKQLYETRNQQRAAYTPGLVGYWTMDEGHGTQINDRVRSRHIFMDSPSWYINNENRAAHLDGSSPIRADIATFNPTKTDNYAVEFWFRGNKPCNMSDQTLLSVLNGITIGFEGPIQGNDVLVLKKVSHSHNNAGAEIQVVEEEIQLSNKDYKDGNWHHFALNVQRGTSAIAYIDGEAVKVIPEEKIPGITGKWMLFGGEELMDIDAGKQYAMTYNHFTGDIDEIRIWSAALDGQLIKDRMYERMENGYPGLVGYFPMEEIHRTDQGKVTTDFSMANFGEKDYRQRIVIADADVLTQSVNAPSLKPGSTNMLLDDSQFDFTVSADQIYFSFPDSSLPLMDNNDFVANVNYIKDEHGNNSETVTWMFHTDFAAVGWTLNEGKAVTDVNKYWDCSEEVWLELQNKTGMPQAYEISGLPSWMTLEEPVGVVEGESKYLKIIVGPTVPVGKYTEYLYVTDRLGIRRVMQLNLTVRGDEPDWVVNPDLYESNMMVTGQVYVGDKISEITETMVAAFDEMGLCRGVASPRYVNTRDAYYVDMVIYGAAATELSTGQRELTFKMYDASTGKLYPHVNITLPDGTTSTTVTYAPDAMIGSYNEPVKFTSTDDLQQTVSLPTGWTWMSIYVSPSSTSISDVLPQSKSELKKFRNVKGKTQFATAKTDGSDIIGELTDIVPGSMYKVQVSSASNFNVFGKIIDTRSTPQTISPGFNWIGTLSNAVMSPEDAFAGLMPENGDMVKNRRTVAVYRDGVWEGTLKSIVPGEGYIYESKASQAKTFNYPTLSGSLFGGSGAKATLYDSNPATAHYQPVDDHRFPDNMTVIAVVKEDGYELANAEVAAFIGGECRGAVQCNSGYYFLTVMGSATGDLNDPIELRVYADGHEYIFEEALPFISDAVYGTLDEPYQLDINATGIRIVGNDDDDDSGDWYTLQGFKVGREKPTRQGVYIHNGKKITIK